MIVNYLMKKFIIIVSLIKPTKLGMLTSKSHISLGASDLIIVKRTDLIQSIDFTGSIAPLNQVDIASQVEAQVLKVLVEPGQYVKANQVLAYLDNTNYKQNLADANAIFASSKIDLVLKQDKLAKYKELVNKGFVAKISYDQYQADYEAALQILHQKEALRVLASKKLNDTTVISPFAGTIYEKNITQGGMVSLNSKLFALADLDTMEVTVAVPSNQINQIQIGQTVSFSAETGDKIYQSKVVRINPIPQKNTHSYLVYINFDNRNYQLKSGQFIKGNFVLNMLKNAITIPKNSIKYDKIGCYILQIVNNKVVRSDVKILLCNNEYSAITGVKVGDKVISGDIETVKDGDVVSIIN